MRFFRWLKHRWKHKLEHFSYDKVKDFIRKNGLAFAVIFAALGNYVHPAFYAGIPASLILCFHWLAVPILWGIWLKISGKEDKPEVDCCGGKE